MLKITTQGDEIKELKNKTEERDHQKILKSLKKQNDRYKIKYESLSKMRVFLFITEILTGSASTLSSRT